MPFSVSGFRRLVGCHWRFIASHVERFIPSHVERFIASHVERLARQCITHLPKAALRLGPAVIETAFGDDLIRTAPAKLGHDCGDKTLGLADQSLGL